MIHAAYFHSAEVFPEDGTVVILGAGESAHDIAELAVTARTKSVIMCHRDGFMIGPKRAPTPIRLGRIYKCDNRDRLKPIDTCVASLFDTAYVPPVLQRGPLLWEYYDKWIKGMFWLISGTSAGLDQWAGEISKDRHHIDSSKPSSDYRRCRADDAQSSSSSLTELPRISPRPIAPGSGTLSAHGLSTFRSPTRKDVTLT